MLRFLIAGLVAMGFSATAFALGGLISGLNVPLAPSNLLSNAGQAIYSTGTTPIRVQ